MRPEYVVESGEHFGTQLAPGFHRVLGQRDDKRHVATSACGLGKVLNEGVVTVNRLAGVTDVAHQLVYEYGAGADLPEKLV